MKLSFLIDENLPLKLRTALFRRYPTIDVLRVGDEGAPSLGTLDPDVLLYLETTQRVLVTDNRQSMPGHIADHFAENRRHWGIFIVRKDAPFKALMEVLFLYWSASEAEEWINRIEWLDV